MIIVKTPIKHDGTLYPVDSIIENISDEQAQLLVDSGAAAFPNTKAPKKVASEPKETTEDDESGDPLEGVELNKRWSKTRILGFARSKGFEVTDEMTKDEIIAVIEGGSEDEAGDSETEDETSETPEK